MAATTLSEMPRKHRAGDTFLLELGAGDYPADESWTLEATFRKPNGADVFFTSTANGSSHLFSINYLTTQDWVKGDYTGEIRAVNGSQRFTVWTGYLEILPDLNLEDPNYDARTHARKMLDLVESVLENRASKAILSTTIAGQSISRYSPEQLLNLRDFYRAEVAAEEKQALLDAGQNASNQVKIRFNQAT